MITSNLLLVIIIFVLMIAGLVLNAMRGSDRIPFGLGRWVMAVLAALSAWLISSDLYAALALGAVSYIYQLQPWGRWYTIGKYEFVPDREPSTYEGFIQRITNTRAPGDNRALAFYVSAFIFALPGMFLVSPLFAVMPVLFVSGYVLALKLYQATAIEGTNQIGFAEKIVGPLYPLVGVLCGNWLYPWW